MTEMDNEELEELLEYLEPYRKRLTDKNDWFLTDEKGGTNDRSG